MDSRQIPFTKKYPKVLNTLILDYLPTKNIRELTNSETRDIDHQLFLLPQATELLKNIQNKNLENLINVLTQIPDTNLNIEDLAINDDTYAVLCNKYKHILEKIIVQEFDKEFESSNENLALVHDCIMHFCLNFPTEAGAILNEHIPPRFDDDCILLEWLIAHKADTSIKSTPIEWLIEHNADRNVKSTPESLSSLERVMLKETKESLLKTLIDVTETYPTVSKYIRAPFSLCGDIVYSLLVIASLFKSEEIVSDLVKKFPDQVATAMKSLTTLLEKLPKITDKSIYVKDFIKRDFTENTVKTAIAKLVLSLNKEHEPLINNESKEITFKFLQRKIGEAETIIDCIQLYNKFINTTFINQADYSILGSLNPFNFWSNNEYPSAKKQFIEMIQKGIYNLISTNKFTHSFKSTTDYYNYCNDIFDSDIFSNEHHKRGVTDKFKSLLGDRINALKSVLLVNFAN